MAVLSYMSTTKTETLTTSIEKIHINQTFCGMAKDEEIFGDGKPTHVVTAITYGGNAHFQFYQVC